MIRDSIDKFLKCDDLKEGFARVRCPECSIEFFVAFSCRQRCCCPFSLARIIKETDDGKVFYLTGKSHVCYFQNMAMNSSRRARRGIFQVFKPLEFLARVTLHIPEKGQHQILYFSFYSNKQRGMRKKKMIAEDKHICSACEVDDTDSDFAKKRRMTWVALIKSVYEVVTL